MSWIEWHLAVNHLPVIGTSVATGPCARTEANGLMIEALALREDDRWSRNG